MTPFRKRIMVSSSNASDLLATLGEAIDTTTIQGDNRACSDHRRGKFESFERSRIWFICEMYDVNGKQTPFLRTSGVCGEKGIGLS